MCRRLIAYAVNGGRKRIQQSEFTEKAWQAIVAGPELAQQSRYRLLLVCVRCKRSHAYTFVAQGHGTAARCMHDQAPPHCPRTPQEQRLPMQPSSDLACAVFRSQRRRRIDAHDSSNACHCPHICTLPTIMLALACCMCSRQTVETEHLMKALLIC